MNSVYHARSSVRRFGGQESDYYAIHEFIDSSKAHVADVRHRALLHSSFGIFLVERVFGRTITLQNGREIPTREVAEQHVLDDLGRIPSVQDYFNYMAVAPWMGGPVKRNKTVQITKLDLGGTDDIR